ncbi:Glutamate dehydrogenase, NAD-specific [Cynara cardunculus var. scolymus]|uniref:Glutamate dehydrogenase, NAD-specific n=1 Tax=Cynara cardunculus var. scolymus TaxID=59895 RepID=A0A118K7B2_CYNCS|nr:Glutamate dehydrogenase, NAD-specific [Cynara cardunculus var. scolymus]
MAAGFIDTECLIGDVVNNQVVINPTNIVSISKDTEFLSQKGIVIFLPSTKADWVGTSTTTGRIIHIGHTPSTGTTLIHPRNNRIADPFQRLHLVLELIYLCQLIPIQPLDRLLHCILHLLLVLCRQLRAYVIIFDGVPHAIRVVLQRILRLHFLLMFFVLCLVFLRLLHHFFYLLLREPTLVVCNCDFVLLPCRLVLRRHVQDPVSINVETNSDLWNSTRSRWDPRKLKLAQQISLIFHPHKPGSKPQVDCRSKLKTPALSSWEWWCFLVSTPNLAAVVALWEFGLTHQQEPHRERCSCPSSHLSNTSPLAPYTF